MAWVLATAAAVTLSWWGVHTVMSGTAYDPPLAVPLTTRPLSSSTQGSTPPPGPPASPSPSPSTASPSESASASASAKPTPKPTPPAGRQPDDATAGGSGSASGTVKGYSVSGGRVVFDLGTSSAALVSATPEAGWRMQLWKQDFWIRVTFTRDGREVSVFCTWHDHPPAVEIVDP